MTGRSFEKSFSRWLRRLRGGKAELDQLDEKILVRIQQRMQRVRQIEQSNPDLVGLEEKVISAARKEDLFEGRNRSGWKKIPPFASGALAATVVWLLALAVMPGPRFFEDDSPVPVLPALEEGEAGLAKVSRSFQLELDSAGDVLPSQLAGELASMGYVRFLESPEKGTAKLIFFATEANLQPFIEFLSEYGHEIQKPGVYLLELRQ